MPVTMTVRLYKGSASVISRTSPCSVYSADLVTFEESSIAYDHHDAEGFIRLNGLRLRNCAARNGRRAPAVSPPA
ncbi:Arginosuccinate synthase [Rhizobium aethiopicum]|uniref:argininosuccinate synthase n=1 Tax=Rhizobium aethiopicum TaxID=1138170 RepID=A0A1C3XVE5_9HYPH|nr:Arginosuccinate synthase [Rhizobium aethiopicum]